MTYDADNASNTPVEPDFDLDAIMDDILGESTSLETLGSMARATLTIEDKKYAVTLELPPGFPERAVSPELLVAQTASRLASDVFQAFVRHYYSDDEFETFLSRASQAADAVDAEESRE